jgi:2-oxoglutarate dehydrogenase E2 component (dihydrolipoamide succinyltransferase)
MSETYPVALPKYGLTMQEATVEVWRVSVGERVEVGTALCEVVTDKVTTEIESPVAGVVQEIKVPEGENAAPGDVLAYVAVE